MESDQYTKTRTQILGQMRERWGTARKSNDEQASDRIHQFESFLMPFLDIAEFEEEAIAAVPLGPNSTEIRTMAENFRKIKKDKPHPLQEPIPKPGEGGGATGGQKRRELMLEIASAHFRSSMGSWMSSVAADHEVTETPIKDLENLHMEAAYRLKVLNTIVAMTEKEVDAIESQIKARNIQIERALAAELVNGTEKTEPKTEIAAEPKKEAPPVALEAGSVKAPATPQPEPKGKGNPKIEGIQNAEAKVPAAKADKSKPAKSRSAAKH